MKLRTLLLITIAVLCFSACKDSTNPSQQTPVIGNYEYLLFNRAGGGQKIFSVHPTTTDTFQIKITKYNFHDTLVIFELKPDTSNTTIFQYLDKALNGQIHITGDFKQPTAVTGTWSYFYLINNGNQTEITNSDLRVQLSGLEGIVEHKMQN